MATQADDVLDLAEEEEVDELPEDDGGDAQEPADDEGEEFVGFEGDEEAAAPVPETDLIKHLRQQIRDRDKKLAQTTKPQAEQPVVVGDRPTMEGCEYDQERFDAELDAWDQRRDAKRQQDQRAEQQQRQQSEAWNAVTANYAAKKAALKFADKDVAEAAAFEALSPVHQAVIAKVANNPALFTYAAGKSPARLNELAAIDDPLVLASRIGAMEATMKTGKRPRAPEPEKIVRGGTVKSSAITKQLEKMEAAADKSGDRSELIRFKRDNKLI